MTVGTVTIVNRFGLHARSAAKLINTAREFSSTVAIGPSEGQLVDGKSIMKILQLAATPGTELVLKTEGEDHEAAFAALAELIADGFGEND